MKNRLLSHALLTLVLCSPAAPALAQQTVCALPADEAIGIDADLEVAYVPNRSESSISVVKVSGGTCRFEVVRIIPTSEVGNTAPTAVFIAPDGRTGWIVQSSGSGGVNTVGVIETRSGTVGAQIPIAPLSGSLAGAMRSDGTRLYVSNLLVGSISVVDTVSETSVDVPLDYVEDFPLLPVPRSLAIPIGLKVSPDDSQLWVTTSFPGTVGIFDLDDAGDIIGLNRVIYFPLDPTVFPPTFDLPPIPVDLTFSGDTAHVVTLGRENDPAIGGSTPDAYYRIDIDLTNPAPAFPGFPPFPANWHFAPAPIAVGSYAAPFGPGAAEVVVPSTGSAWISNAGVLSPTIPSVPVGTPTTYVTTVAPGGAVAPVASGGESPVGMAPSPDRDFVYVTNFGSGDLQIYDAATESPITPGGVPIAVGEGPTTPFGANIPRLPTRPAFAAGACGSVVPAVLGSPVQFDVSAETTAFFDDETGLELTVAAAGLPPGATLTPALPLAGTVGPGPEPDSWTTSVTTSLSYTPSTPGEAGRDYVVDFTAAGAFASTLCQVTIRVSDTEPPPDDVIPFDPCEITKLRIDTRPRKGTFDFAGRFGVSEASDGIDPLTEDVTVSFDDVTLTIPAGSFVRRGRRVYRFRGVIDGVRIHADLKAPKEPRGRSRSGRGRSHRDELWSFKIKGKYADLSGVGNDVDAGLRVGNDGCFQTVRARIKH